MKLEKQSSSAPYFRKDKGIAGLTILLSVIAMVFIIGFLVMVFAVIGGQLQNNVMTATSPTVNNESANGALRASANQSGYSLAQSNTLNFRNPTIVTVYNTTSGGALGFLIPSANYTVSGAGVLSNATATTYNFVNVTYSYTFDANNTATQTIGQTTTSIAGVSAWFPIIITITVMVALILLTVIIIVAIRSSGILAGGN